MPKKRRGRPGNRSKKYKVPRNLKKELERIEEENKPAYEVLEGMLDVSQEDREYYIELVDDFNFKMQGLKRMFRSFVFKSNNIQKSKIKEIVGTIEHIEEYFMGLKLDETFQAMCELDITQDTIENILDKLGFPAYSYLEEDGQDIDWDDSKAVKEYCEADDGYDPRLNAEFTLVDYTIKIFNDVERFEGLKVFDKLKDFFNGLGEFIDQTDGKTASFFVEDLGNEMALNSIFMPADMVRRSPHLHFTDMDEGIYASVEHMESLKQRYIEVAQFKFSNKVFKLLGEISTEENHRGKLIEEYGAVITILFDDKYKMFEELVRSQPSEMKKDLIDLIAEDISVITCFKNLKKYLVKGTAYSDFLLSFKDVEVEIGSERKTCGQIVQEIYEHNPTQALGIMFDSGSYWFRDQNVEFIVDVAMNRKDADVILRDYMRFLEDGNDTKKEALKILCEEGEEDFNELRKKLKKVSTQDLDSITVNSENLRSLNEKMAHEIKGPKPKKIGFFDLMMEHVDEDKREAVGVVLQRLSENKLRNRVRTAYIRGLDVLYHLCDQFFEFQGVSAYTVMLRSHTLFNHYLNNIFSKNIVEQVTEISKSATNNFSALTEYFVNNDRFIPIEKVERKDQFTEKVVYDRVHVFGGKFSTAAKEKIAEACPIEVRVADFYSRRKDSSKITKGINEGDAIIFITSMNTHPLYYILKRHCKKNDLGFYHLGSDGTGAVINSIFDIVGGKVA